MEEEKNKLFQLPALFEFIIFFSAFSAVNII
jgi:hypothetical protein